MCGWKDRCRDGNLRRYCHVSPILFGWFFVEASPRTYFRGFFGGNGAFWDSIPVMFFKLLSFLPATSFCCFLEGKRDHMMFC